MTPFSGPEICNPMFCRKRAEYGSGEHGFKHRVLWVFCPPPPGEKRHININFLLWLTSRWPWDKQLVVPGLTGPKSLCVRLENTGNINFSLWLTGGLSQGCPDFQKVYVFKVYVPFSCPITEFRGESSVSSFQPIFVCQSELTEIVFTGLTEFGAELSEFSLSKQYSRNSTIVTTSITDRKKKFSVNYFLQFLTGSLPENIPSDSIW